MHVGEPRIVREFVRSEQQAQQQVEQAGIVSVSVGIRHTACVSAGGELYTFGHNMCGQLGHGDRKESSLPRLVHVTNSGDGGGGADGQQQRGAEPLLARRGGCELRAAAITPSRRPGPLGLQQQEEDGERGRSRRRIGAGVTARRGSLGSQSHRCMPSCSPAGCPSSFSEKGNVTRISVCQCTWYLDSMYVRIE
jgi:hypothetical protein